MTNSPYMAIQVIVSSRKSDYKVEYREITQCENIDSVVSAICSGVGKLSEKHAELSGLKHQIKDLHEILKNNLNRKNQPELSPYQYTNKRILAEHYGLFYVIAERVLIDPKTQQPTNSYCIVTTKTKQNTNWGANLRIAANTMFGVSSLSYFAFLEKNGAEIKIPDSLIYKDKIKGYPHFEIAGLLLSAMSYEGYINYIGEHLFDNFDDSGWRVIQGKPEVLKKTQKIIEQLKIDIEESARPYSSIIELFKLRNEFAHPKIDIQTSFSEKIIPTPESLKGAVPDEPENSMSRFEETITRVENLVSVLDHDLEAILSMLWEKAGFTKVEYMLQSQATDESSLIYGDEQSINSYSNGLSYEVQEPRK